ncbi:hypothetical protein [Salirhabdus sp. Marseille-P4669]|uniref:hypothetical protein n=1 Tax=Salirhabdus sp. Marseille-P4669 TaxID=2042310 RepID=UPI000C7D6D64|nr:hypothetical protein [Salirhabdus sp. Marseille-P4669]
MRNPYPSLVQTLSWLRRNRFRKKWKLYKLIYSVVMDFTYGIYLFAFLVISLIAFKNYLSEMQPVFAMFQSVSYSWFITILIAFVIRSLFNSTRSSGVYITSAEYQLTLLPYKKEQVWLYCLVEKFIKITIYTILLFLALVILLPVHSEVIFLLCFTLWISNLTGTVIEWRLFQLGGLKKFFCVVGLSLLLIGFRLVIMYYPLPVKEVLFSSYAVLLVILIVLLAFSPLKNVDWAKVVSFGDVKVWNMMAVQRITKVQVKPPTKFQLLNQMFRGKRAKRPLPYKLSSVSVRLWLPFFKDHLETIFKTIGTFLLLMVVFGFQGKIPLQISFSLGIVVVNAVISSLFVYQFQSPLMQVLPWRFADWYQSFKKWYLSFIVLYSLVAAAMLYFYHYSLLSILLNIVFYIVWLRVDLDLAVIAKVKSLKKEWETGKSVMIRFIGFVSVFFSISYQWISIVGILSLVAYFVWKGPIPIDNEKESD